MLVILMSVRTRPLRWSSPGGLTPLQQLVKSKSQFTRNASPRFWKCYPVWSNFIYGGGKHSAITVIYIVQYNLDYGYGTTYWFTSSMRAFSEFRALSLIQTEKCRQMILKKHVILEVAVCNCDRYMVSLVVLIVHTQCVNACICSEGTGDVICRRDFRGMTRSGPTGVNWTTNEVKYMVGIRQCASIVPFLNKYCRSMSNREDRITWLVTHKVTHFQGDNNYRATYDQRDDVTEAGGYRGFFVQVKFMKLQYCKNNSKSLVLVKSVAKTETLLYVRTMNADNACAWEHQTFYESKKRETLVSDVLRPLIICLTWLFRWSLRELMGIHWTWRLRFKSCQTTYHSQIVPRLKSARVPLNELHRYQVFRVMDN